jgi:uroporphyrinogen-III synthase
MVGELTNLQVLVTRQFATALPLYARIKSLGAKVQILPLFNIESLLKMEDILQIQQQAEFSDLAICTSKNAAQIILPHLQSSKHLAWAAVGPGTARYMQAMVTKTVCYPHAPPYDSANLIATLQASDMNLCNSKIQLFTGYDGNNELKIRLLELGAKVTVQELYRRTLPAISVDVFTKLFSVEPEIDIIVITCTTSLVNLMYFADLANIDIRRYKLLVVSNRIYKYAIRSGFLKVYVAASMSTEDILSELLRSCSSILNV